MQDTGPWTSFHTQGSQQLSTGLPTDLRCPTAILPCKPPGRPPAQTPLHHFSHLRLPIAISRHLPRGGGRGTSAGKVAGKLSTPEPPHDVLLPLQPPAPPRPNQACMQGSLAARTSRPQGSLISADWTQLPCQAVRVWSQQSATDHGGHPAATKPHLPARAPGPGCSLPFLLLPLLSLLAFPVSRATTRVETPAPPAPLHQTSRGLRRLRQEPGAARACREEGGGICRQQLDAPSQAHRSSDPALGGASTSASLGAGRHGGRPRPETPARPPGDHHPARAARGSGRAAVRERGRAGCGGRRSRVPHSSGGIQPAAGRLCTSGLSACPAAPSLDTAGGRRGCQSALRSGRAEALAGVPPSLGCLQEPGQGGRHFGAQENTAGGPPPHRALSLA